MEVDLTPDLEAKLTRLAAEQGRDTRALVREAVERLVNYDEWFVRDVEKGLAAADRGELIDPEEIGKLIAQRYPGKCALAGGNLRPPISRASSTISETMTPPERLDVWRSPSTKARSAGFGFIEVCGSSTRSSHPQHSPPKLH
jgi:predicted transcriptional regulator